METLPLSEQRKLLYVWLFIGKQNVWIQKAIDPEFTIESFVDAKNLENLKSYLSRCNWCLGQAFYYKNLCLINQVEGGDEWLAIRDDIEFSSITFCGIIKAGNFERYITLLLSATHEELLQGNHLKNFSI